MVDMSENTALPENSNEAQIEKLYNGNDSSYLIFSIHSKIFR